MAEMSEAEKKKRKRDLEKNKKQAVNKKYEEIPYIKENLGQQDIIKRTLIHFNTPQQFKQHLTDCSFAPQGKYYFIIVKNKKGHDIIRYVAHSNVAEFEGDDNKFIMGHSSMLTKEEFKAYDQKSKSFQVKFGGNFIVEKEEKKKECMTEYDNDTGHFKAESKYGDTVAKKWGFQGTPKWVHHDGGGGGDDLLPPGNPGGFDGLPPGNPGQKAQIDYFNNYIDHDDDMSLNQYQYAPYPQYHGYNGNNNDQYDVYRGHQYGEYNNLIYMIDIFAILIILCCLLGICLFICGGICLFLFISKRINKNNSKLSIQQIPSNDQQQLIV